MQIARQADLAFQSPVAFRHFCRAGQNHSQNAALNDLLLDSGRVPDPQHLHHVTQVFKHGQASGFRSGCKLHVSGGDFLVKSARIRGRGRCLYGLCRLQQLRCVFQSGNACGLGSRSLKELVFRRLSPGGQ